MRRIFTLCLITLLLAAPITLTKITGKVDLPNLGLDVKPCMIFIEDLFYPLFYSDCSGYNINDTVQHLYDEYYLIHIIIPIRSLDKIDGA